MIVGTALWGYALFVTGTAPIIDWKLNAPWWIADYLPNMQSELGLVLVCLGSLAPYLAAQALRLQAKKAPETERFLERVQEATNKWLARSNKSARGGSYKQARRQRAIPLAPPNLGRCPRTPLAVKRSGQQQRGCDDDDRTVPQMPSISALAANAKCLACAHKPFRASAHHMMRNPFGQFACAPTSMSGG